MKKFIPNKSNIKVKTPEGLKSFDGLLISTHEKYLKFHFENGSIISCSFQHRFDSDKPAIEYRTDDQVSGNKIIFIDVIEEPIELYDLVNVKSKDHLYNHDDDFVSHN